MAKTRIREIIVVCKNCNTVVITIHNALIPIHWNCKNIECQVCHTELSREETLDMWIIEPGDESYKDDYYDKEELK